MSSFFTRTLTTLTCSLFTVTTLAGCLSTGASTASPKGGRSCDSPPSATNTAQTIAILGQTGRDITYYKSDIALIINNATNSRPHILVNGVGDPTSAPDLAANLILTGDGPNAALRSKNLECKKALVHTAIDNTLTKANSAKQPDVFAALNVLSGNLRGNASMKPVDVLLFTSLVAKGGGVDLTNPKTLANPKIAINTLSKQGLIPRLKNVRLYAVRPDEGLTDTQAAELKEFWRLYAIKAGAQLVTWTDHLATFPVEGAIAAADTSLIQITRTTTTVTATLAGDVLFDPGSPVLRLAAAGQLNQLLDQVNQYTGKITITGYTDVGGDEASNRRLSVARSVTVRKWLIARHVSSARITTAGAGSHDPVHAHPRTTAEHQANRRVVVVLDIRSR